MVSAGLKCRDAFSGQNNTYARVLRVLLMSVCGLEVLISGDSIGLYGLAGSILLKPSHS